MDWSNVTAEELVDALREVDWKSPRPVQEFFSKFTLPKTTTKWSSRVKCNTYYYRTNYLIIFVLSYVVAMLRNPQALLALAVGVFALFCVNDPFAGRLSDELIKVVRIVHSQTAARLRAVRRVTRRNKTYIKILGVPRRLVVIGIAAASLYLMWQSRVLLILCYTTCAALGLPLLHATMRAPNLKARLASAREEFRAVWRGYQTDLEI